HAQSNVGEELVSFRGKPLRCHRRRRAPSLPDSLQAGHFLVRATPCGALGAAAPVVLPTGTVWQAGPDCGSWATHGVARTDGQVCLATTNCPGVKDELLPYIWAIASVTFYEADRINRSTPYNSSRTSSSQERRNSRLMVTLESTFTRSMP